MNNLTRHPSNPVQSADRSPVPSARQSREMGAREFLGFVLDKVMNGCLGNKGWPHGAITVGEAGAEYSFLGGEDISRCCKYKGFTVHGWLDRHISRELYAGVT